MLESKVFVDNLLSVACLQGPAEYVTQSSMSIYKKIYQKKRI